MQIGKLRRALDVAQRAHETLQARHHQLLAERKVWTDRIERLEKDLAEAMARPAEDPRAELLFCMDYDRARRGADQEKATLEERIATFDKEKLEPSQVEVQAAAVRRRAIEKLIERRMEAERQKVLKAEQLAVDEAAVRRYTRS